MSERVSVSRRAALAGGAMMTAGTVAGFGADRAQAAAPMLGASSPNFNRFELGDFEITTLFDGAIQLEGPFPIFGQDQFEEDVAELAQANFLPADRMEIGFTPVLVNTGSEVILFDAGNGAARRPNAGSLIPSTLAAAGYSPDQIDVVVLTHFHPDHIGGLMEEGAPAYPNARYVANAAEFDFWTPEDKLTGNTERVATLTQSNVVPLADKMTFIKDGDDVASGVSAIGAYGHTPGHTVYHLESGGERLVIWADLANHYVMSIQRPDWHVRFDMDKEAAAASRKKIFDMVAADRIPFTGYHMPFPALGYIEKTGEDYRYVPASYQLKL